MGATRHTGGRPPVGTPSPIRFDPELRAALDRLVEAEGVPLAEIVRRACRRYVDGHTAVPPSLSRRLDMTVQMILPTMYEDTGALEMADRLVRNGADDVHDWWQAHSTYVVSAQWGESQT